MKKLSLEQMKVVEGGWPQWAGGYFNEYKGCDEFIMPDGTIAHQWWGTENCLWGIVKSELKVVEVGTGPCIQ